jgi:hypothetical protein
MKTFLLMFVLGVAAGTAQDTGKFTEGPLAGFSKSPTEHIINQIDEPFVVRSVAGVICFERSDNTCDPLRGVLLEIRGPDDSPTIRHTSSDDQGNFRIRHVPVGAYKFKTTLNGFKSTVGTIVVSKKGKRDKIRLEVLIGN